MCRGDVAFGPCVGILQVQEKIDDLTRMDKKLYDAGEAQFEKVGTLRR